MAEPVRPKDLAPGVPTSGADYVFDSGTQVLRAKAIDIVNAATPLASQADAEEGTDNVKRMTPLRVMQATANNAKLNAVNTWTANQTVDGNITLSGTVPRTLTFDAPAGQTRQMRMLTSGSPRWAFSTTTTLETGSDAGTDFRIRRYSDAGATLGDPLIITRANGRATFSTTPTVNGTKLALGDLTGLSAVNTIMTQDSLTYPIGNELETYTQWSMTHADKRNDQREFIYSICANFTHGPASSGAEYQDHKTLRYEAVTMDFACRKAWVYNPLLTIKPTCVTPEFAAIAEFDVNNFKQNFGSGDGAAGLAAPSVYGIFVAGAIIDAFSITAAIGVLPGKYYRGFMVSSNSATQAAFDDYSSAASSFRDSGTHVIGINLQGTYSSAAIAMPGAANAGINISGTKTVASIVDGAATPVGLFLNGTYSLAPVVFGTLPRNFANDAAAAAGGIPVGGVYRNGSVLNVRIA